MSDLSARLASLRKACQKKKSLKPILEPLGHGTRVILNSKSQPLEQSKSQLITLFSTDIIPLYVACPEQSIHFVASVISHIYETHLSVLLTRPEHSERLNSAQKLWEDVIDLGIAEGLQNYLQHPRANRLMIGDALYHVLCTLLYQHSNDNLGSFVKQQICVVLIDSSRDQKENKIRLRDDAVLGGARLGQLATSTNDYLYLDSLLSLACQLVPRGRDLTARKSFVADMFCNPIVATALGDKITRSLEEILLAPSRDGTVTVLRLLEKISEADVARPQAFTTNTVLFPIQRAKFSIFQERVFIDETGIRFSIPDPKEEGMADAVEIQFDTVTQMRLQKQEKDVIGIELRLKCPPKQMLRIRSELFSQDSSVVLSFDISFSEYSKMKRVLETRGLVAKTRDFVRNAIQTAKEPGRKESKMSSATQALQLTEEPACSAVNRSMTGSSPTTELRRQEIAQIISAIHEEDNVPEPEIISSAAMTSKPVNTRTGDPDSNKAPTSRIRKSTPPPRDVLSPVGVNVSSTPRHIAPDPAEAERGTAQVGAHSKTESHVEVPESANSSLGFTSSPNKPHLASHNAGSIKKRRAPKDIAPLSMGRPSSKRKADESEPASFLADAASYCAPYNRDKAQKRARISKCAESFQQKGQPKGFGRTVSGVCQTATTSTTLKSPKRSRLNKTPRQGRGASNKVKSAGPHAEGTTIPADTMTPGRSDPVLLGPERLRDAFGISNYKTNPLACQVNEILHTPSPVDHQQRSPFPNCSNESLQMEPDSCPKLFSRTKEVERVYHDRRVLSDQQTQHSMSFSPGSVLLRDMILSKTPLGKTPNGSMARKHQLHRLPDTSELFYQTGEPTESDPLPGSVIYAEITEHLVSIQNVILSNIKTKFNGARYDIRVARGKLLIQARDGLDGPLKEKSQQWSNINKLSERLLEEKRDAEALFNETIKSNSDVGIKIQDSINSHDKSVLKISRQLNGDIFGK
ncbi:hypothetical protein FRC02_011261 [Tulasnella sp. 418]|nr:hypothetical protein FRC02_011261 [Tulasnella sp. 418]